MSDFTFSATTECEMCGKALSSSTDDCDHDGRPVATHVFRRMRGGRDTITGVESAPQYKWHKLSKKIGDDWIAYQYIGTRDNVDNMLDDSMFGDIEDLPMKEMALNAPDGVEENT